MVMQENMFSANKVREMASDMILFSFIITHNKIYMVEQKPMCFWTIILMISRYFFEQFQQIQKKIQTVPESTNTSYFCELFIHDACWQLRLCGKFSIILLLLLFISLSYRLFLLLLKSGEFWLYFGKYVLFIFPSKKKNQDEEFNH